MMISRRFATATREIQSTLNENLDSVKTDLLDVANTLASKDNDKTLTAWMKEGEAKDYIKKWNDDIIQKTDDNFKAAEQKGVLRKQILDKIEMLSNAESSWTKSGSMTCTGQARTARNLLQALARQGTTAPLIGQGSASRASNRWRKAGIHAKEQSKTVFDELLPEFQQESNTTFAALTDDPSQLADWKSELQDKQESIQETLATEDEVIRNLAEGPYQNAALETFDEFRIDIYRRHEAVIRQNKRCRRPIESVTQNA